MLHDAASESGVKLTEILLSTMVSVLCMLQYILYVVMNCQIPEWLYQHMQSHVHSLPLQQVDPGSLVLL